ncbi:MAG: type II secretion system protein M [Alcanivorax sp.]|nr:type II secretion system protein M [Alcanivorax sp.]
MRESLQQQWRQWRAQAVSRAEPALVWYRGLARREQLAVLVLGVFLGLLLIYQLMWAPVLNSRDQAINNYLARERVHSWIQDNAEVVRQARDQRSDRPQTFQGDWISVINASASQAGLTLRGFTPEGNNAARIQLEQQEFARVIAWLQMLEQEQGIRASAVEISSSQTPGTVNVRATLRRGG